MILALGTGALALLAPAPAAPAPDAAVNLIRNGGFEQPPVQLGSYQLYGPGQSFPGWNVVGARGNLTPISGKYASHGLAFPARSGCQWLDLTGLTNTATGVAQTVKTTPGATYTLRLSVGNVVNPGGIYGDTSSVLVLVNGKRTMAAKNADGAGKSRQVWKDFFTAVRATSASTTIAFRNADSHGDSENGLDAVAFVRH